VQLPLRTIEGIVQRGVDVLVFGADVMCITREQFAAGQGQVDFGNEGRAVNVIGARSLDDDVTAGDAIAKVLELGHEFATRDSTGSERST
jgi:hypothetical protein